MTKKSEFLEYVLGDVLARIEGISHRSMFGGYGIYQDGHIFAIIAYDKLYFKVDESNREDYESRGCEPFTYQRKNHPKTVMSYYELPAEIMENPNDIEEWVDKAVQVSINKSK